MKAIMKNKIFFMLTVLLLSISQAYSAHYPHTVVGLSSSNQINCKDCHEFHGDPSWGTGGFDLDNTFWNKLCYSCHNDVVAASRTTHSSLQIDTGYGDWAVECKTCHDPHEHEQINWGASSYLYSSTVSNVLIDTPVAGQSTIVDASPSWTDGQFDASGDDFFIVAGDINDISNNVYKVISNSGSNLVVEGTVDTSKTSAGDTFAIILGKLVRKTVSLDQIVTYTGVSTSVTSNSVTESGAGWTPDQFVGLKLIPNAKLLNPISYDITSNTSDTIYVTGTFSGVEAGDPFQVVGGIINSPSGTVLKTGNKSVKFFNTTGTNSFADGDTTYDGICEVCHTQTTYHRNNSSGDHTHNAAQKCTSCHEHTAGFKPTGGECVQCHNGVPSGATYVTRDVVGSDFTQASRHVFGGTVGNWDCIVCHREGDETEASNGNVATTSLHNNAGGVKVDLRDVDNVTSTVVQWDKYDGTCSNPSYNNINDCVNNGGTWTWNTDSMLTGMDTFCLNCHDSDGASGINVKSTNDGVNLNNTRALTPFNPTDDLGTGGPGGSITPGPNRTQVLDVNSQLSTSNPSFHPVLGQAYSTTNANWGANAWVNRTLKNGTNLQTVRETARLHCADCHTVDQNAHGGANDFMLTASTIDDTCWQCHSNTVYSGSAPDETLSRFKHQSYDGSHTMDPNRASTWGSICFNCHAGYGYGDIHGMNKTYSAGTTHTSYRFMPGAYMLYRPNNNATDDWTTSGTQFVCYFRTTANKWTTCSQHDGSSKTNKNWKTNYSRGTPGSY